MATTGNNNNYPIPSFHFNVDFKGSKMSFSEVSGLSQEVQVLEYRHGDSPEYSPIVMPGIHKFSHITLKRGVSKGDNDFFKWISTVKLNTVERRDVTISLLNEDHKPVVTWKVRQCFPVKVDGTTLKSTGNDVAVESIELVHEGLTIENK